MAEEQADIAARKEALAHAVRCWDAERENSARLNTRRNLMLSAVGLFLGLAGLRLEFYRAQSVVPVMPPAAAWTVSVFLALGLVLLLASTVTLFVSTSATLPAWLRRVISEVNAHEVEPPPEPIPPPQPKRHAADQLPFSQEQLQRAFADPREALGQSYINLMLAYEDLRNRNSRLLGRLDWGQQLLIISFLMLLLAILIGHFTSLGR